MVFARTGVPGGRTEVSWLWRVACRLLVLRVRPWLRQGTRRGWRRQALAALLLRTRHYWDHFYTVQGPQDEQRLRHRGTPWPTAEERAHLGPGVYAWQYRSDARAYFLRIRPQRLHLRILQFVVPRRVLRRLTTMDVDRQPHPDQWMYRHSRLGGNPHPEDHGAQYVRRATSIDRGTEAAVEHYFSHTVFPYLCFCEEPVRVN